MKVASDSNGEIHQSCRLFVHKYIKASASWYIDIDVIKFQDHPVQMVNNLKEDLDRRFEFDDGLQKDYILWFIETCMKNVRYVYHKHWIATGRGEKHPDCPARSFPKLVKYWLTTEAKEEAKKHRDEGIAAKRLRKLADQTKEQFTSDSAGSWEVSY